jgi:hypothetical protein
MNAIEYLCLTVVVLVILLIYMASHPVHRARKGPICGKHGYSEDELDS